MKDSKPASFVALHKSLGKVLAMADALSPKRKAMIALLQQKDRVDPSDPEYKFHSNDIIEVCEDLLKEYKASKKDLDDEYDKTSKACDAMKKSLRKKMKANTDAMDALEKNIEKLAKEIAQHREDLVEANGDLQDDELYLKDLGARCEARANDYDQRSAMRGDELAALTAALKVLTKDVKGRANAVNERAFVQEHATPTAKVAPVVEESAKPALKSISFLQEVSKS